MTIIKSYIKFLGVLVLAMTLASSLGCSSLGIGGDNDKPPEPITFPDNPIEKAAFQGLQTSYKNSTMWQIQKVKAINVVPMAPKGILIETQDPKELYCVCLEYEARYKVSWTTTEGSPWERTVRNILVMKTQSDQFLALQPMNICQPFCE
jgi:hypothetical protein